MNIHTADIAARLKRYLDRREPPSRVAGKSQAEADEIRALVAVVGKYAPKSSDRLQSWWPNFEAAVGEISSGYWPTERQCKEAAEAATKDSPKAKADTWVLDPVDVASRKMERGDAVGEGWLYGRNAVDMIRRKLVTQEVMTAYRSAAFLTRRDMYGEAAALAWEVEAKAAHETAKEMIRNPEPSRHNISIPNKTSPAKGFVA